MNHQSSDQVSSSDCPRDNYSHDSTLTSYPALEDVAPMAVLSDQRDDALNAASADDNNDADDTAVATPDASTQATAAAKPRTRRCPNPQQWQRTRRKMNRVAGQQYTDTHGRLVSARQIGPDCNCKMKCYTRIGDAGRRAIFDGFYSLGSYDEQNAYLYGLIVKKEMSGSRRADSSSQRCTCHYQYFARDRGRLIRICKTAFANIHSISFKKIRTLCQKLDMNVMFPRDMRGLHSNRPTKITEPMKQSVRRHIEHVLTSPVDRRFTRGTAGTSAFNVAQMHQHYRNWLLSHSDSVQQPSLSPDAPASPVKLWVYSRIFNEEFRLRAQPQDKVDCSAPGGENWNRNQISIGSGRSKRVRAGTTISTSTASPSTEPATIPHPPPTQPPPTQPPPLPVTSVVHLSTVAPCGGGGELVNLSGGLATCQRPLQLLLEPASESPRNFAASCHPQQHPQHQGQLVCVPMVGCCVELQSQPLNLHQAQQQQHQQQQSAMFTLQPSQAQLGADMTGTQSLTDWTLHRDARV